MIVDELNLPRAAARALRAYIGAQRRELVAAIVRSSGGSSKARSVGGSIFVNGLLDYLNDELTSGDRGVLDSWAAELAGDGAEHAEYGTLFVLGLAVITSSFATGHPDGMTIARYLALRGKQLDRIYEDARLERRRALMPDPSQLVDRNELVASLLAALRARDAATCEHSRAVGVWAERVARSLGMTEEAQRFVGLAATLHDVGKLATPKHILLKPGPLDDDEWVVMRDHSAAGAQILEQVPSLRACVPIVRSHHERIDGQGYPDGLTGNDIPIGARIVAVADAFHAMISNRPYRAAAPAGKALATLVEGKGTRWDALVVETMIGVVRPETKRSATVAFGVR